MMTVKFYRFERSIKLNSIARCKIFCAVSSCFLRGKFALREMFSVSSLAQLVCRHGPRPLNNKDNFAICKNDDRDQRTKTSS
jgi:hypothetical protein